MEHALISLIETIRRDLGSGLYVCAVFVEAFNTVDHEILHF